MSEPRAILLIEHHDATAEVAAQALPTGPATVVVRVRDGVEAIDFLYGLGAHAARRNAEPPVLVVLDWNTPGLSARYVLSQIRSSQRTRGVPVIVLTSSGSDDVAATGTGLASCTLRKPPGPAELVDALRIAARRWLEVLDPAERDDA